MFFKFPFVILIKFIFILIPYCIYADFNYIDKNIIYLISNDKKNEMINYYKNRKDFFILMSDKFDKDNSFNFQFTNKDNNVIIDVNLHFKEIYYNPITKNNEIKEKIYFKDSKENLILEQDLKDFTVVVFKIKLLDYSEKYIICNDCNSFEKILNSSKDKEYIGLFQNFKDIKEISVEYISNNKNKWDNAHTLFQECKNLEKIDFKDHEYNLKNISVMFGGCKNLNEIKNIKSIFEKSENIKDCQMLFSDCEKLKFDKIGFKNIKLPKNFNIFEMSNFKVIDLSSCDFSNVEQFTFKFAETEQINFNITSNTNNLKDLKLAFFNCKNIKKLDLRKINVENVTSFTFIFAFCKNLEEINITGWKFNEKVLYEKFFAECYKLKKIIGLENIIVKTVQYAAGCTSINCDLFFCNNKNLETLDLSTFKFEDCDKSFIERCNIKTVILPNDPNYAKLVVEKCLNNKHLQNIIKNLKYGDYEINNINDYDDLLRFISDPENYLNNRNKINDEIRIKLQSTQDPNIPKVTNNNNTCCCLCFTKCCCCKPKT